MAQPTPLSPAPSTDGVLQPYSMMNAISHTSYPRDARTPERNIFDYSQSRYSTPVPDDDLNAYDQSSDYSQLSHDGSFGNYSSDREARSVPYEPLSGSLGYTARPPYTPEASPPTPCPSKDAITMRSGLNVSRKMVLNKSLKVKGGGVKKRTRDSKQQSSTIIDKPLSEVAKDMPDILVADIASFVVRTTEERLKETSRNKKVGQVKRPMNAFMLYRKAYQNVAKTQCAQNNHQHVSKVCGAAWPLEPKHMRDQFDEWARIERSNHQKAHPQYKFTPSKPQKAKRDGRARGQSTPFSDGEDSDWADSQGLTRSGARALRNVSRLSETPSIVYNAYEPLEPPMQVTSHHVLSAYPTPGRLYQHSVVQSEYGPYDLNMHQHPNALGIMQDMVSRTPSPSLDYSLRQGVDLNPAYANPYDGIGGVGLDHLTDPSLLPGPSYGLYDGYDEYDGFPEDNTILHPSNWIDHPDAQNPAAAEAAFDERAGEDYLRGTPDDWKLEPLEETSHFDSWATAPGE